MAHMRYPDVGWDIAHGQLKGQKKQIEGFVKALACVLGPENGCVSPATFPRIVDANDPGSPPNFVRSMLQDKAKTEPSKTTRKTALLLS